MDNERALAMAVHASAECTVALRKMHEASGRKRALSLRWARAVHRHLAQLLSVESLGDDAWGALTDEERRFVFAEDPPREALLARLSDLIRRTGVADGEALLSDLERRLV